MQVPGGKEILTENKKPTQASSPKSSHTKRPPGKSSCVGSNAFPLHIRYPAQLHASVASVFNPSARQYGAPGLTTTIPSVEDRTPYSASNCCLPNTKQNAEDYAAIFGDTTSNTQMIFFILLIACLFLQSIHPSKGTLINHNSYQLLKRLLSRH